MRHYKMPGPTSIRAHGWGTMSTSSHAQSSPSTPYRGSTVIRRSAPRQPKDPKAYKDMDELRERLHADARGSAGFISGTLNWLSNSGFGQAPAAQPWWSPARLYRALTWAFQPPTRRDPFDGREDPNDPMYEVISRQHAALGPLLLLSRSDMRRMARRYPPVLEMSAEEVALRLVYVREALPGCDACLLIEQNPRLFLSPKPEEARKQLLDAAAMLREGLRGAAIADVIMADPEILFMDLEHGLRELRDLWDVDEVAMANSSPKHLALAVRALCNNKQEAQFPIVKG